MHATIGTYPLRQQIRQQARRAVADRGADQSQIHTVTGDGDDRRGALHRCHGRISAGQPDRVGARTAHGRDQTRVDRARQDRHDDIERSRIGDSQSIDLLLRDARGIERRVDLAAAAVDHDQRRVLGQLRDGLRDCCRRPQAARAARRPASGPATPVSFAPRCGRRVHAGVRFTAVPSVRRVPA